MDSSENSWHARTRTCGECEDRRCRYHVCYEAPGHPRRVWCTRALAGRQERALHAELLDDAECNVCEYADAPVLRIALGDTGGHIVMCTSCIDVADRALSGRLPCFVSGSSACLRTHTLLLSSKAADPCADDAPAARVCGHVPAERVHVPTDHWRCLTLSSNESLATLRARLEPVAGINDISAGLARMGIRAYCLRLERLAEL